MTQKLDFDPATLMVASLAAGVRDDQLARPTPCEGYDVAALLDHLMALAIAFKVAAEKSGLSPQSQALLAAEADVGEATSQHLHPAWRELLPGRLRDLSAAWRAPSAWEGDAEAGGVTMPATLTAKAAVDELVLHGWDMAQATGQHFECDQASAQAALDFTTMIAEQADRPEGLFGPVVEISAQSPVLDRALALSGRNPSWASVADVSAVN